MKNKIRVLVTHQIHFLNNANKIILLEEGRIKASGTYSDFVSMNLNLDTFEKDSNERKNSIISTSSIKYDQKSISEYSEDLNTASIVSQHKNQICIDNNNEQQKLGNLTKKTYLEYFKNGGGIFGSLFYFIMLILSQVLCTFGEYWLSYWASQESIDYMNKTSTIVTNNDTTSYDVLVFKNRESFYSIFLLLTLSSIVAITTAVTCYFSICLNASKNLHRKMFNSIMDSTVRFFDLNPFGRIMNRFSKDIGSVDEALPFALFDFLQTGTMILISLIVIISINYWILIPMVPLTFTLLYVRKYFLKSSIEIKRIEGISMFIISFFQSKLGYILNDFLIQLYL